MRFPVVVTTYYPPMGRGHIDSRISNLTEQTLRSIRRNAKDAVDITLVEDGFGHTPHRIRDLFGSYCITGNESGATGIANAWNVGMNSFVVNDADDPVLISNNDILVASGEWDTYARREFEINPHLGVLFPTEIDYNKNEKEGVYFFGAFFFIRHSLWLQVGGCPKPPRPNGQYEDAALWELVKRAEYQFFKTDNIRVYHVDGGSNTLKMLPDFHKAREINRKWYEENYL